MKKLFLMSLLLAMPLKAEESAFVEFRALKPEVYLTMAQAALTHCRDAGFQVGVMVTDRFGIPQIFLRDRYAGVHVFEMTERKAWTAVTFRTSTTELADLTQPGTTLSGLRDLSKSVLLGGGLPVMDGDGSLVAGIGISGAPSPEEDEACAIAGIEAIEDKIAF
ncbi:heme-binding protein [Paracoccaceae bacterium]|nr:heme-binding protein [Paracoccaceae bacterium]